jgi:MFS family permease
VTQFTLSALFTPARSAVLANVVARKELVTANALDSLTWSTMLALGAFLGGVVAAVFGREPAFVADAFTFLLSAWFISRIAIAPRPRQARARGAGWLEFAEGFRYLWNEPFILGVTLAKAGGSLVWGAINVLEVNFADAIFPLQQPFFTETLQVEDAGTATLGIIYVVSGLGTGLGPLVLRRWLGDAPRRLLTGITAGMVLLAVGIGGLGAAPTLGLFLVATLVRTVGSGVVWVFSAALLQMLVPDRFRGRVFAFEFALLTLTQSLSIFGAGYLQDAVGLDVRTVTAVMAALGLVMWLLWLVFFAGALRHNRAEAQLRVANIAEEGGAN